MIYTSAVPRFIRWSIIWSMWLCQIIYRVLLLIVICLSDVITFYILYLHYFHSCLFCSDAFFGQSPGSFLSRKSKETRSVPERWREMYICLAVLQTRFKILGTILRFGPQTVMTWRLGTSSKTRWTRSSIASGKASTKCTSCFEESFVSFSLFRCLDALN